MKLKDIPDMERYLANDCYCPGEIYDISGFFYLLFSPESSCKVIEESDGMIAVVATSWDFKNETDSENPPQAILFLRDDPDKTGKIIDAQRVDATENNIGILKTIVQGKKPDGRKIDEFEPGSTAKSLEQIFSICDAVIVD